MILLTYKDKKANLIDYTSVKYLCVVASVLGAETFPLADAFKNAILLQHYLKIILNRTLKIALLSHSATLFNVMTRNAPTTENRFMVGIKAAQEAYNNEITDGIIWIRRTFNLADAMAKPTINAELLEALVPEEVHAKLSSQ